MFCFCFCITSQQRPCCILPAEGSDECINPHRSEVTIQDISQPASLTAQGMLLFISNHFQRRQKGNTEAPILGIPCLCCISRGLLAATPLQKENGSEGAEYN